MVFALGLAAAAFIAYLLAVRRRLTSLSSALLAAFVLTVTQIVVSELLLAMFGLLRPVPLALVNTLLSAGVFVLAWRQGLRAAVRTALSRLGGFFRLLVRSPLSLLLLVLLVAISAWQLFLVVVGPESSYDGLAYHLPIAFSRIDFGDLHRLAGWPPWIPAYPEHAELLVIWMSIFDRSPALVDGVQWAFWPAGVLAVYTLARKLGAPPTAAFQGSALFGFAPAVILLSHVAYNDLILGALFLIALSLLLERDILPSFVAGTAMGLIVGIKYAGVIFPVVGGIGLLAAHGRDLFKPGSRFMRRLLAYSLPILTLGLPWYVANWIALGNPLWPFRIEIGGRTLFPGIFSMAELYATALSPKYESLPRALLGPFLWLEPVVEYNHDAHYSGLGVLWIALGIPAILYTLLDIRRSKGAALTLLLVSVGGGYLLLPNNWKPRYALFITALGAVGLAWVLHSSPRWTRRLVQVLLALGVLYTLWTVVPAETGSFLKLATYARLPSTLRPHIGWTSPPAYRWLDQNSYPGTTVVYGYGVYLIAPLWGNNMGNRVIYVDTPLPDEWHINDEDYSAQARQFYENSPIVETWHREALLRGVNYVFVERHPLNTWIGTVEGFERVFGSEHYVIYRARPMELYSR